MPLTIRSQFLARLLPVVHAGIRIARLPASHADDALQQSLVALVPHVEQLRAMPDAQRAAYVFFVASRTAMNVRKRLGRDIARATDREVDAWSRDIAQDVGPEHVLRANEGAKRAERVFGALEPGDQRVFSAVNEQGLSVREAASKLGMSRSNVGYRLQRVREALARASFGTTWLRARKRTG